MATATPSPTPNPDAMRFSLGTPVGDTFTFSSVEEAADHPFAAEVLATEGVASIFGTADFVTVTRSRGAEWEPIVEAVQEAAERHL